MASDGLMGELVRTDTHDREVSYPAVVGRADIREVS